MLALNSQNTAKIAKMGAEALARVVQPNGRFVYRYFAGQKPVDVPAYNALRHFGSVWSMLDVARKLGRMPEVLAKAELAARYAIQHCLAPCGDGMLGVSCEGRIKLGGNGLALVMLAELYELKREEGLLDLARQLASYVVSQQRDDGDFVHSRDATNGQEVAFRSDYYTGEALLGLMRLYEITGETEWLDCVVRSENELLKRGYGVSAQSHWMLYALERLHAAKPDEVYLEHAARIAAHILRFASYRDDGRSTPIACRSEGLLAYCRMLKQAQRDDLAPSAASVQQEVLVNLRHQLESRLTSGAFMRTSTIKEIRIDYVQHNISSYLGYHLLITEPVAAVTE